MSLAGRMKNALDVLSTIAVILAAGMLMWTLLIRPRAAPGSRQQVEQVQGLQIDGGKIIHVSGKGPIAIVEFSDFQCPFCGTYARETLPAIKRDLVDSGAVRYVALHFPLEQIHPLAMEAAEAAECAGKQDHFWEMHERLFVDAKALAPAQLVQHAQAIGLDQALFKQCIEEDQTLEKVRADQAEGRRLGLTGTPSFFIGTMRADGGISLVRRIRGAAPVEVFAEEIAKLGSSHARVGDN
jgi:protein-disulfide isomerase